MTQADGCPDLSPPGTSGQGNGSWPSRPNADLIPITADLQSAARPSSSPVPRPTGGLAHLSGHASSTAIMGECKRQGAWHLPEQHAAFALMGSVVIDLRQACLASHDSTINASAIMGDIKVIVPAHVNVVVDGTPIMGDYGHGKDKVSTEIGPDSPTIRVRGVALMGSVSAVRLPPPGTPKKFLGTY